MVKRAGKKDYRRSCHVTSCGDCVTTFLSHRRRIPAYAAYTRGFAFVAFKNEEDVNKVLSAEEHLIMGKKVRSWLPKKGRDEIIHGC
jgi:hypothetical protein